jgi:hypothetical protein
MVTSFLRLKNSTQYEILLAETALYLLEMEALRRTIFYRHSGRFGQKHIPTPDQQGDVTEIEEDMGTSVQKWA